MQAPADLRDARSALFDDGFAVVPNVTDLKSIQRALTRVEDAAEVPDDGRVRRRAGKTFAVRQALAAVPELADLASGPELTALVRRALGTDSCVLVRSILFDKNPAANWAVPWHQDTTIAVRERLETPGFGPWSVKAGVVHVQPPASVLESMVTARVHLDDCDASNGALRVIPGSHREGILEPDRIAAWRTRGGEVTCECRAGDVLLMRPLLLHASFPAASPRHRRVLHLEFSASPLPNGLEWHQEDGSPS